MVCCYCQTLKTGDVKTLGSIAGSHDFFFTQVPDKWHPQSIYAHPRHAHPVTYFALSYICDPIMLTVCSCMFWPTWWNLSLRFFTCVLCVNVYLLLYFKLLFRFPTFKAILWCTFRPRYLELKQWWRNVKRNGKRPLTCHQPAWKARVASYTMRRSSCITWPPNSRCCQKCRVWHATWTYEPAIAARPQYRRLCRLLVTDWHDYRHRQGTNGTNYRWETRTQTRVHDNTDVFKSPVRSWQRIWT